MYCGFMALKIEKIGEYELVDIDVDKIDVSDHNSRKNHVSEDIEELVLSIKTIGLQQPPLVQKKGDRYELIMGQRRLLAFKQLRMKKISVHLKKKPFNSVSIRVASTVENIHRKAMIPKDLAEACVFLYEKTKSKKESANILGISIPTFNKYLGYHGVPDNLKKLVKDKKITVHMATRLSQLSTTDTKVEQFARMIFKMPNPARERYFTVFSKDPDAPLAQIKKSANKDQNIISFKVYIPSEYTRRFVRVAESESLAHSELGQKAIMEYLTLHRYRK